MDAFMKPNWPWREVTSLGLAFIGDAVWEITVRNHVLERGVRKPDELHRRSSRYVRAKTQAWLVDQLRDTLTETELRVLLAGRNAKPGHTRKNADVLEYRHATGFESLIGYLYGSGETERLQVLCDLALQLVDEREAGT
jgi:ribonuclease III family protein